MFRWVLNSIPTTGTRSLEIDEIGYVKLFDTVEILTAPQIADFTELFLNKRAQGNKGEDVPSGGTIFLSQGTLFDITGAVTIDFIRTPQWREGSVIYFQFNTGITLNHNSGSVPADTAPLFLNGSVNAVFTAGSTLSLAFDGTFWRELGRMVG